METRTRYERVKEFTEKSLGHQLPSKPRKMTRDEVFFVTRMILEEVKELLLTVAEKDEDTSEMLMDIMIRARDPKPKEFNDDDDIITEQVDAFVDIDYYGNNACAKVGMDVDQVFDLVHGANMNKLFPDGTFHKDEHGKIIKPPNWTEADVKSLVQSWSK